jgi:NADPH:quinone reductase-like Zn-dependent oxidoreductase
LRGRHRCQRLCLVRAAVLHEHGGTPRYGEFDEPAGADGVLVEVAAAGLHHLDLHKATGTYYTGPPPLPSVVGTDGVGRLPDGRRVYFDRALPPYGSMCERTLVPEEALLDVAEGVEDVVAAALGNTGLAAWLALTWRAELRAGETVLVLGATGAVGTIAFQAARLLGAGRVIAAAIADERLERLRQLGPDAVVELDRVEDLAEALRAAAPGGVNVTIDLLWGEPGLAAMQAAARFARHVEIGSVAGSELVLPAALIRSLSLDVRGFSVAQPPVEVRREGYFRLTELAARGEITVDVEPVALEDVAGAWERQGRAAGGPKLVIVPNAPARREESPPT